jgi:hypothetical protein
MHRRAPAPGAGARGGLGAGLRYVSRDFRKKKRARGTPPPRWPSCPGRRGCLARAIGPSPSGGPCHPPARRDTQGNVSRQLAGAVVLGGVWSCTSAATRGSRHRALLRFFSSSGEGKRAVPRPSGAAPEGLTGIAELRPLFPGGPGGPTPLLHSASFFSFQEDCVPSMNTGLLGHVAISWHRWPVT